MFLNYKEYLHILDISPLLDKSVVIVFLTLCGLNLHLQSNICQLDKNYNFTCLNFMITIYKF
jgi:hypothetical protein